MATTASGVPTARFDQPEFDKIIGEIGPHLLEMVKETPSTTT
jgi:hypothetical protein